ncbi:hypothetical protein GCM10007907_12230 [Chitinimonas prasina]|uniref:Secreted protein n=1 Tax=Chitinimonas prasina TaxID=1434937 RepID=A0ABQ5YD82_9NEIS|nr:hypothetical protein GCM10007907_12230 [Chitinimonas prasina]
MILCLLLCSGWFEGGGVDGLLAVPPPPLPNPSPSRGEGLVNDFVVGAAFWLVWGWVGWMDCLLCRRPPLPNPSPAGGEVLENEFAVVSLALF